MADVKCFIRRDTGHLSTDVFKYESPNGVTPKNQSVRVWLSTLLITKTQGYVESVADESFVALPMEQALRVGRYPPGGRVNSLQFVEESETHFALNATILQCGLNVDTEARQCLYRVRFDVHDNYGLIVNPVQTILREDFDAKDKTRNRTVERLT